MYANRLDESKGGNNSFIVNAYLMSFTVLYVDDSCICTIQDVCTSLPDDFILSPSACMHANVAVTYDVCSLKSVPILVMEKVETSLSSLLLDVGDMVTVRERIDLAFGIVSAIEYFHDHLKMTHGLISGDTVFVTQQLSAKMLDPSAAYLLSGRLPDPAVTFEDDMEQLIHLLQRMLSDVCPCDRLRTIAVGCKNVDGKGDCMTFWTLFEFMDGLRQTAEYCCGLRGRQLLCQDLCE